MTFETEIEAKVKALCEHLRRMGLNATVESISKRVGGFFLVSLILGSVRVAGRNIDLVELVVVD